MKVKDLLDALSALPPEADVFVWDAGDRLGLVNVDTSFLDNEFPFVDLNTEDVFKQGETA
jgi:hypothetical protein